MGLEATAEATGAMPATGATPAGAKLVEQTPQPAGATPAAAPTLQTSSATDEASLGESGKAILREARRAAREAEDRAKALEAERDQLKTATQSEAEKAQAAAVKEAEKRVAEQYQGQIRRSEIRRALTAAGISESELDLASAAGEFAKLRVDENGDVTGLTEAVSAFKAVHAALFGTSKPGNGIADLGGGVRGQAGSTLTREQIQAMTPDEVARRMPEIDAFLRTGAR